MHTEHVTEYPLLVPYLTQLVAYIPKLMYVIE